MCQICIFFEFFSAVSMKQKLKMWMLKADFTVAMSIKNKKKNSLEMCTLKNALVKPMLVTLNSIISIDHFVCF